ncbi:class I SAM-dependent methyltransferase [Phormidium tenue FACHB-886]|nr:class I SAM-dependent methyltransferase [Phormidium tenue FACHB-886]
MNDSNLAHSTVAVDECNSLQKLMQSFSPTQAIIQLRNQYFDEVLHQQAISECRQVVMLGAGFDPPRTVRLATPNVHYFEIDQATILQHKLAQSPIDRSLENSTYITGNYLQPNLIELLQQHQFDVRLPTYFVWAGSVPSLKRSDIISLIDTLRNQVYQFQLSFDYLSHQLLSRSAHAPAFNQTLDCLEHLDINWTTVFKDIAVFTKGLGLELLDTCSIAQLHDRYCPQSTLPSSLLQFYWVCTIAKQSLTW